MKYAHFWDACRYSEGHAVWPDLPSSRIWGSRTTLWLCMELWPCFHRGDFALMLTVGHRSPTSWCHMWPGEHITGEWQILFPERCVPPLSLDNLKYDNIQQLGHQLTLSTYNSSEAVPCHVLNSFTSLLTLKLVKCTGLPLMDSGMHTSLECRCLMVKIKANYARQLLKMPVLWGYVYWHVLSLRHFRRM